MKKLDKFIAKAFLGPFVLTLAVVVFIFLIQLIMGYLDEFLGKGLGLDVYIELVAYFSLNVIPMSLPLAILLASLITYGNLGEHFELTAIKSSGISLLRTMRTIFISVALLVILSYWFSNRVVPFANLRAYSLLYDIRQKKPSLEFKEGTFYHGIPGYSIKVAKNLKEENLLKGLIIYDHTEGFGNTKVTIADSGRMYTIFNDRYLKLELYHGQSFNEGRNPGSSGYFTELTRARFNQSEVYFNLSSFDLNKTPQELFAHNRIMKNVGQLSREKDSLMVASQKTRMSVFGQSYAFYTYMGRHDHYGRHNRHMAFYWTKIQYERGSPEIKFPFSEEYWSNRDFGTTASSLLNGESPKEKRVEAAVRATNVARNIRGFTQATLERIENTERESRNADIEMQRKFTNAMAVLTLFLIGAPLGAIIKKGGLGVPVLVSIGFFIVFYVVSLLGEKYAKEGVVPVYAGMWASNLILLPFGMFFLRQARLDARLFDVDFYTVPLSRILKRK